jgi:hypothetical protein
MKNKGLCICAMLSVLDKRESYCKRYQGARVMYCNDSERLESEREREKARKVCKRGAILLNLQCNAAICQEANTRHCAYNARN